MLEFLREFIFYFSFFWIEVKDVNVATFWVTFFSAIFFAATAFFLIWQIKIQQKALVIEDYAKLRQHHHDLITLQVEHPELGDIYSPDKMPDKYKGIDDDKIELSQDERKIFNFYNAEFDLYERVWLLKQEKRGKVTEYEWIAWIIYLEGMSRHWLFRFTFNTVRTFFDDEFMKNVCENIIEPQDKGEDADANLVEKAKKAYCEVYTEELVLPNKGKYIYESKDQ